MKRGGATASVPDDVVRRLGSFVFRVGAKQAAILIGVGESTLVNALDRGRMRPDTRDRLVAGLERVELEDAERARDAASRAEVGA